MGAGPRRLTEYEGRLRLAMALSEAESEPDVTAATSWASVAAGAVFANLAVSDDPTNTVRVAHAALSGVVHRPEAGHVPHRHPHPVVRGHLTGYPALLPDLDPSPCATRSCSRTPWPPGLKPLPLFHYGAATDPASGRWDSPGPSPSFHRAADLTPLADR